MLQQRTGIRAKNAELEDRIQKDVTLDELKEIEDEINAI